MYLAPTNPSSGEQSNYDRFRRSFVWKSLNVAWTWRGTDAAWITAQSRMVLETGPLGWTTPVSGNHNYAWQGVNGHHLAQPEVQGVAVDILAKAFVINNTGVPLPNQDSWVARDRFEIEHVNPKVPATALIPYRTPPIFAPKLKDRDIQSYSTLLPKTQLWVRPVQVHQRNVKFRRRFLTDAGDSIIVGEQKYSYHGDAVSTQGHLAGPQPPAFVVRDGPRGVGTVGYVSKIRGRRGHKGDYFIETGGRLAHHQVNAFSFPPGVTPVPGGLKPGDGYINTIIGWRTTVPAIGTDPEAGWEHIGDWSRVPGSKRMNEPWGFAVARLLANNVIDPRDGFDFWIPDSLNHRWLYVDGWPLHPDISSVTGRPTVAQFPPLGYTPVTARGPAVVIHFQGNTDGTPSALINGPWDLNIRPQDGKLYGTNFEGNSIVRCNLDGTGLELVVSGPAQTDAQLGIPSRLFPSSIPLATLRANMRDGPQGTCTITRPQGFDFDSNGDIIFSERYTYAIRKYSFATGLVTTLALIPAGSLSLTSSSSSTQDISLTVDNGGTCGPKDDIFTAMWANGTFRHSATGVSRGAWDFQSGMVLRNGPLDLVDGANYGWACDAFEGRILHLGNDSGSQYVEITKRLPTDPQPDTAKLARGVLAYNTAKMDLTHGHGGVGEIGFPNAAEMGSWDDVLLTQYLTNQGIPPASVGDVVYWVRWVCVDFDYTAAGDVTPPMPPFTSLTLTNVSYGGTMYNLTFQGTAGPEPDIAKVRVYINNTMVGEKPVTPGAPFSIDVQYPYDGDVTLEHSMVDSSDNESGRLSRPLKIPDKNAPAVPQAQLVLSAVVWTGA